MDRFLKQDLDKLLDHQDQPQLSLYMPTYQAGSEIQQNSIRFKNLIRQAEDLLIDYGFRSPEAQEYLEPARDRLLLDETFWQQQSNSLALFITPNLFQVLRLPFEVEENVMVGSNFYVLPLFTSLKNERRFYILALSQDEVRLLEGTKYSIEEVDLERVPASLAEALKWDDPEKQTQYHTVGAGRERGDRGRPDITFHGHGVGSDDEKVDILRFFQKVDNGLKEFLGEERAPLILAGVEYLFPIYREANSYNHLVEQGIPGNPEELKDEDLQAQAWEVLEPIFDQEKVEAIAQYAQQAGMDTGQTSSEVDIILPAAYGGRVAQLFVSEGAEIWGSYDLASNRVEVHPERSPGSEELINLAAIFTFRNGGTVYRVPESEMPDQSAIAGILRY